MNRTDWQELAEVRITEAAALLNMTPPHPDGAYYLAGYAVECALKACIAKSYNQYEWPEKQYVSDCHTHKILSLVRLAGLEAARVMDATANPSLALNWNTVNDWTEQSRYERHSYMKAQSLLDAVTDVTNGVLPWIKVRW